MTYALEVVSVSQIVPNPKNARTHSKKQIKQIAESIRSFGFAAPVLIDERSVLIAGHGRLEAAKSLNLGAVPAVRLTGLSDAKKRALMLADNRIAQNAGWDREMLSLELSDLTGLLALEDIEISITGFAVPEIDDIALAFEDDPTDPDDEVDDDGAGPTVSQRGSLWQLGSHRLLCGSALDANALDILMDGEQASAAFLDPPYNLRVSSIGGRGRTKHAEFAMASGQMSDDEFRTFLRRALEGAAGVSRSGAVHYVCMDWRHIGDLMTIGAAVYEKVLNLVVWDKTNAGQGSFYRSQHELIGVFRKGDDQHLNNVELGKHGRSRSNVWRYAGVNTFRKDRMEELATHPTVKPVAMIADALKDCTRRRDIVLDTFSGSGSTIMAAERVGRRGYGIEIEPRYVDAAIRRWEKMTGRDAILADTGETFTEVAEAAQEASHAQ